MRANYDSPHSRPGTRGGVKRPAEGGSAKIPAVPLAHPMDDAPTPPLPRRSRPARHGPLDPSRRRGVAPHG